MSFYCRLPGRSAVHRNRLQRGIRSVPSLAVVGCSLLLSKARHCVIARIRRLVIARTAYQVGTVNAVAQNVPVNCAEVRRFPSHNRKGVDVHSGIPLIRIAITMAYAARAVHPCARFYVGNCCCSDLLEAIDIPGSEIIAIMLANFLLFKPASEDILL